MKIVIGDLTEIQADAIINPANTFKLAQKLKIKSVSTPLLLYLKQELIYQNLSKKWKI